MTGAQDALGEADAGDSPGEAPFDLAGCPAYPQPLRQIEHQPLRFCARCTVETVEPACFVCGGPTEATMPAGWYRGAVDTGQAVIPIAFDLPIVPSGTLPGRL